MSVVNDVLSFVKAFNAGEFVGLYAAVKVVVAAVRAKAAKEAAKVEADAYTAAHKAEADVKGAEVKVKAYVSYWIAELKKAI